LTGLAKIAILEKDNEGARSLTEQAIKANPKDPAPWIFKGHLMRSEGKSDDAIAAFGQAIALQPSVAGTYIERANDEIATAKFDAAKADVDAARKLAPATLPVTYTQARLDATQGRFQPAREAVQKVLAVAPAHQPSILLAGMIELNLGNTQAAEQYLKKYVDNFPNNAYARTLLAQAMLRNSRPADANAIINPMLKADSKDPQLLALAGESLMQVKDFGRAAAFFEKASALAPKNAALHTSLAQSQLGMGDGSKAIAELETAATLDPNSPRAGVALVQAELRLKHYDKALAAVQKLEQAQPNNPEVFNLKGAVYLAKGDLPKARSNLEKAAALKADYFAPIINLALMDKREGKPEAAKKLYEAFLAKNPKHFGAMWGLADIAAQQGHADQATKWLEKASAENPALLEPAIKLGHHYLAINERQKALSLLRKFQTSNPSNPELLDLLGQAQMVNNDPAGAVGSFSTLVSVLPKSATAHMRLAGAHLATRNETAAAEDLKRAVAAQPDLLPARAGQIEVAMRLGKWDEAMGFVRELQKLDARSPVGYVLEGDLRMAQKHPQQAVPAYEKAFSLAKSPELLIKLVEAMKLAGKSKEADAQLAQWRQANPNDPMILFYQAQQYSNDKQFKPAAEALRVVLKLSPDNPIALNNLALVYQQDKDPRALETAERAALITPNSPTVMDTLGYMLVEQGNAARGLPLLQKATTLAPDLKEIRFHLAVALHKSGDKASARKELERLLTDNKPFPQADEAMALLKTL
jgi:putative PEP-CTERM system TPR-repeat lipoprotein